MTETTLDLRSCAAGQPVRIVDRVGSAETIYGTVTAAGPGGWLVTLDGGKVLHFSRNTGAFTGSARDEDRYFLALPAEPGSEEYGDLLIRQGALQTQRERIQAELDVITAQLDAADKAITR